MLSQMCPTPTFSQERSIGGLGLGFSGRAQSTGPPNLLEALALGVGAGLEISPSGRKEARLVM